MIRQLEKETKETTTTYCAWIQYVDQIVYSKLGVSYQDLPDCSYHDWYDAGRSAGSAARAAIRCAKDEE